MIDEDEEWVVRNLKDFGDTVIPNRWINLCGTGGIEQMILERYGIHISIRRIRPEPFWDVVKGYRMLVNNRDLYIAEICD